MDMKDILKIGAMMFVNSKLSGNAGSALNLDSLTSALSNLTGGNSSNGGFDIGDLLSKMNGGGMGDVAKSWLGDGQNAPITNENVTQIFGQDKLSDFARQLGLSEDEAVGGLQDALPHMVDKSSIGGSLLDSIGGISGAIKIANQIFGR